MGKVRISREFTWDMAHMLANHEGLCRNVHGHTYRMQVQIVRADSGLIKEDESSASEGMVIDFTDLKDIVNKIIINEFDHSFVYWINSTDPLELELAELLKKHGRKVVGVEYRPTVEEMAEHFYKKLDSEFNKINIIVVDLKIWETPTSFAEVSLRV